MRYSWTSLTLSTNGWYGMFFPTVLGWHYDSGYSSRPSPHSKELYHNIPKYLHIYRPTLPRSQVPNIQSLLLSNLAFQVPPKSHSSSKGIGDRTNIETKRGPPLVLMLGDLEEATEPSVVSEGKPYARLIHVCHGAFAFKISVTGGLVYVC